MLRIGAHLSIAGSYLNALEKTIQIGGNCVQIFSSSPRQWKRQVVTDMQINAFLKKKTELSIDPVYFHAPYLINLADSERIGKISKELLIYELNLASKMRVKGSIIHLGSFKEKSPDYDLLSSNIRDILSNTPSDTYFIIENAGNRKIGATIEEVSRILDGINNERIRVCLDTCHLWAGGYDLSTHELFETFFAEFDKKIGIDKLEVFQVNDSKDSLGSFRDRHENIGEGTIPHEMFRLLLTDTKTKNIPFIIETPGFDKKGPDEKNINRLKSLVLAESS